MSKLLREYNDAYREWITHDGGVEEMERYKKAEKAIVELEAENERLRQRVQVLEGALKDAEPVLRQLVDYAPPGEGRVETLNVANVCKSALEGGE